MRFFYILEDINQFMQLFPVISYKVSLTFHSRMYCLRLSVLYLLWRPYSVVLRYLYIYSIDFGGTHSNKFVCRLFTLFAKLCHCRCYVLFALIWATVKVIYGNVCFTYNLTKDLFQYNYHQSRWLSSLKLYTHARWSILQTYPLASADPATVFGEILTYFRIYVTQEETLFLLHIY